MKEKKKTMGTKQRNSNSTTEPLWNKRELEKKTVIYFLENPKKRVDDFCKSIDINQQDFYRKCDINAIYNQIDKILDKEQGTKLKQVQQQLEEQANQEAFEISKLYDISTLMLVKVAESIKDSVFEFRSSGENVKCLIDAMKFMLELRKESLIPNMIQDDPYDKVTKYVQKLIDFKDNDIQNNTDLKDGFTEIVTNNNNDDDETSADSIYS